MEIQLYWELGVTDTVKYGCFVCWMQTTKIDLKKMVIGDDISFLHRQLAFTNLFEEQHI
jgi:hypothetical protein